MTVGRTLRFRCKNKRALGVGASASGMPHGDEPLPAMVVGGVGGPLLDGLLQLVHAELTAAFLTAVW